MISLAGGPKLFVLSSSLVEAKNGSSVESLSSDSLRLDGIIPW